MTSSMPVVEAPGTGDYASLQLSELVHRSAHAEVHRGRWQDQAVAVKLLDLGVDAQRAEREIQALRKLSHPHLAPLWDHGLTPDGRTYLVSPWFEGRDLSAALGEAALAYSQQLRILRAVASALKAVHAQQLVHRDVKPANIFLPNQGPPAVLLDLGHALWLGDPRLSESGQVAGSAHYLAPEQAADRELDGRCDVYSLGAVFYEMLTGSTPFRGDQAAELLRQHCESPLAPPRQRAPEREIPSALDDLCMWMMAKDPAQRLPNAHVLMVAIDAIALPTEVSQ